MIYLYNVFKIYYSIFNYFMKTLILFSITLLSFSNPCFAGYWLVIGSYRQGPGSKPQVSGITSPSVFAIPMKNLQFCKNAGKKIEEDIYKPVWQFDNKWTCINDGN